MMYRGTDNHQRVIINLKPNALNLMFDQTQVLTYDRSGRLWSAFFHGHTYRRGLNGTMLAKWEEQGYFRRQRLTVAEANTLIDRCAQQVGGLLRKMVTHQIVWDEAEPAEVVVQALEQAARFDGWAAERDEATFRRIYDPVGILPPDQYMAAVVQATTGCSFNSCSFCTFYRSRPFRIKSPNEFRNHVIAVREFLGSSLAMRRTVFLGEANALTIPQPRLTQLLQIIGDELGPLPIHAFLDGFSGQRKTVHDYQQLATLGLQRVSIGLESGYNPLLEFVHKPATTDDVLRTVHLIKEAGIGVNLIVLLGLGGDRYAAGHAAGTAALLAQMPLRSGDIVYFSDLVEQPQAPYTEEARAAGIEPLNPQEIQAQRHMIEAAVRRGVGGPQIARYDIHEFIY